VKREVSVCGMGEHLAGEKSCKRVIEFHKNSYVWTQTQKIYWDHFVSQLYPGGSVVLCVALKN
jgi:hypothetical protein